MEDQPQQKQPEMSSTETLAELAHLGEETGRHTDLASLKALFYRVETLAQQHPENAEVQQAAAAAKERVVARARALQPPTGGTPTPPEMRATPTPTPPLPVAAPVGPPAAPPLPWKRALAAGGAIAVILFAGVLGLDRLLRSRRAAPSAPPPSAATPAPAEVVLPRILLLADLRTGAVLLDGQPAGELQDGQFTLEKVPAGTHRVKVTGQAGEAAFQVTVTPGVPPTVEGPVAARNLLAVLVGSSESSARAYSSVPTKLTLDGTPAGEVPPGGLDLKGLSAGDHEIAIGEGKDARKVVLHAGATPALTAFLKLDLNAGTLLVAAGENDVKVTLNGQTYGRRTKDRQLRIPFLPVGAYVVRVSKDGYENPPQKNAQVRKGEETRVEFTLRPIPQFAALRIRDGAPGTAVYLDQEKLGNVGDDRTFSAGSVQPGEHAVELRRERHAPRRVQKQFHAGETVLLSGAEMGLEKLPGTLRLNLFPAESRVTIRRSNESQAHTVHEHTLSLPEGYYAVSATAPGYAERNASVQIVGGETVTADLRLSKEKQAGKAQPQTLGMADWEEPQAWVREGQYLARKGGNTVLFRASPTAGVFHLTVAPLKGKRLQWVLNFVDAKNYALLQLDKKNFYRKDVINGKTIDLSKVSHNLGDDGPYTIQIEVTAGSLVHRALSGGKWTVLDAWTQPARNFTYGKFGFLISGNDKVGLSSFSFTPR